MVGYDDGAPAPLHALFQQRVDGDDALLRLARLRFEQFGLAAEVYGGSAGELDHTLAFVPGDVRRSIVHLPRHIDVLREADRAAVSAIVRQFGDRVSGFVVHDRLEMRARLGECVNMRVTNATNLDNDRSVPLDVHDGDLRNGQVVGGSAFHLPTLMSELSTHVHLVRFDELATDGTSVGWNYVQAPMVGQTYNYRWFVDVALRTVYFHDHQNPNTHQQHGLWAAMNVEPGPKCSAQLPMFVASA